MDHQGVMWASIPGSGCLARGSVRTGFIQKRSNRLDAARENLHLTQLTGKRSVCARPTSDLYQCAATVFRQHGSFLGPGGYNNPVTRTNARCVANRLRPREVV
jgi:hypothetical protein